MTYKASSAIIKAYSRLFLVQNKEGYAHTLPNYDDLIQEIINLRIDMYESQWAQGAVCCVLIDRMRAKPSDIAANINCSTAHIRQLLKTFKAFPSEVSRVVELTWYHHVLASATEDPEYWINFAADNQLSTREMSKAIKGETIKDELKEAEKVWAKVDKIIEKGGPPAEWIKERIVNYSPLK